MDEATRQLEVGKAVENDDVQVLGQLLNRDDWQECEVLADFAFDCGKENSARFFLDEIGVENELKTQPGTLLASAAGEGHLRLVKLLLERGVSDLREGLPLVSASKSGDLEVVKLLVEAGADVNQGNPGFPGPLDTAEMYGKLTIVEYLRSKGAETQAGKQPPVSKSSASVGQLLAQDEREGLSNEALDDALAIRLGEHMGTFEEAKHVAQPILWYYASRLLEWEVGNGGFSQAALNLPEWFSAAADGYRAIGCERAAELLERVIPLLPPPPGLLKRVLGRFFSSGDPLRGWREKYIKLNEGPLAAFDLEMDDETMGWWAMESRLAYVRANREVFCGFDP